MKLLHLIQKKKSVGEIAKEHDRTEGGINSYIRKLAVDYHIEDKRSMEEIQQVTGLSKEQIEDAIKKHEFKEKKKATKEIRKLAVDCHIKDERPVKEIQQVTELSKEQIEDAIRKHEFKEKKKATKEELPKDIQENLNTLLEKIAETSRLLEIMLHRN